MKNIIKKFMTSSMFAFLVVATVVGVMPIDAQAATGLQSSHATLRAANYSDCPGCINWSAEGDTFATGDANSRPIVALGIAYKNNTGATVQGVTVRLSPTSGGSSTSFNGRVWGNGVNPSIGNATVSLPSGQTLAFTGDLYWYKNGSNNPIHLSTSSSTLSSGYVLGSGSIPAGEYGGVVAHFEATAPTPPPPPQVNLAVDTFQVSVATITQNSATLRGETNGYGSARNAWYEYTTSLGNLSTNGDGSQGAMTTPHETLNPYNGWLQYNRAISGLQSGTTYYYQICASIGSLIACDPHQEFTTQQGQITPIDVCPNLSGTQTTVPSGYELVNGDCIPEVTPGNDQIQIDTLSAQDEDESSALLRGYVNEEEDGNVDVWFEWDESSSVVSSGNGNTLSVSGTYHQNDSFDRVLSGLQENETYYFRACGEDQNGNQDCGPVESFTTNAANNNEPDVQTDSATNIDEDSATLNGEYDMNDFDDGDIFFVWSDDENDLDDVEDEDNINDVEDFAEVEIFDNNVDDADDADVNINGLDEDTRYYFRVCALYENDNQDDEIICGSVRNFMTDDGFDGGDDVNRPIPGVCVVSNVGVTSATLSSLVNGNGGSTNSYFQYGPTTGFGSVSDVIASSSSSNFLSRFVSGLAPNTQYYCRMVSENSDGVSFSDIGTFRTGSLPVIPGNDRPVVIVSSGGTGTGSPIFLEIDDSQDMAVRGQTLAYEVTWENTSGADLDSVVLNVSLPKSVRFLSSTKGSYNKRDHYVTVNIGQLKRGEADDMTIFTQVRGGTEGDQLVAEAIIAFESPEEGSGRLLSAIEYDVDTYSNGGNGQLAGLFGIGLLPGIIGLLLALLLILVIVLVARRLTDPRRTEYRG